MLSVTSGAGAGASASGGSSTASAQPHGGSTGLIRSHPLIHRQVMSHRSPPKNGAVPARANDGHAVATSLMSRVRPSPLLGLPNELLLQILAATPTAWVGAVAGASRRFKALVPEDTVAPSFMERRARSLGRTRPPTFLDRLRNTLNRTRIDAPEPCLAPGTRLSPVLALLGSPPHPDGNAGNGILGIPDAADRSICLNALADTAVTFGDDQLRRGLQALADLPVPALARTHAITLLQLSSETLRTPDDAQALLGHAPALDGRGGDGIAALPVPLRRAVFRLASTHMVDHVWESTGTSLSDAYLTLAQDPENAEALTRLAMRCPRDPTEQQRRIMDDLRYATYDLPGPQRAVHLKRVLLSMLNCWPVPEQPLRVDEFLDAFEAWLPVDFTRGLSPTERHRWRDCIDTDLPDLGDAGNAAVARRLDDLLGVPSARGPRAAARA